MLEAHPKRVARQGNSAAILQVHVHEHVAENVTGNGDIAFANQILTRGRITETDDAYVG